MIRLAIVDDEPDIREGLATLVELEPDMRVVATGADGIDAIEISRHGDIDVLLLDIQMPRLDGIRATTAVRRGAGTPPAVLVLTTFETQEHIVAALRAGASGFIGKGSAPEQLLEAIRSVHAGTEYLSPRAVAAVLHQLRAHTPAAAPPVEDPRIESLTAREREMLTLAGSGLSNRLIAERLVISPLTVKTHIAKLMLKLDVHTRAQLVVVAFENNLADPNLLPT